VSVPAQLGTRRLLTVLGVAFGLAVAVGNTIGAGIVRTPGTIAANLPNFWPFIAVWIIGAAYAFLGTNAIAEMATMVPRSGGQYVFVRRGLGDYAGFIVGWSDWVSTCGSAALVAIVIGEYTVGLFPELRTQQVVALAVVAALTFIQWFGVRSGALAQDLTSVLKAVVLLLFVAACLIFGTRNPIESAMRPDREISIMVALIVSLQAVIYSYDGWTAPIYFSEEIRDPGRAVPRSMFGGIALVTGIYLLINISFARVVPIPTLAGKDLAAGAVAQHLFGGYGDAVLRAIMVLALLSTVNSCIMMAPRVIFAMGNDGLFWRGATEVNRGGTPDVALLISSILAGAFIVTGTVDTVIAKLAFFFVANYTLSFLTLFVLRRTEPDTPRPYRAWGHPFTTGIALLASVVFLVGAVITDTQNSLWAVGLLFLSFPAYLLVRRRHSTR
jgi:APA family basic amino acid/polyamine antiporter